MNGNEKLQRWTNSFPWLMEKNGKFFCATCTSWSIKKSKWNDVGFEGGKKGIIRDDLNSHLLSKQHMEAEKAKISKGKQSVNI